MSRNLRRRRLSFEHLEAKALPSSTLLPWSCGHEPPIGFAGPGSWRSDDHSATGAAWRFNHNTETLLTFIADHTRDSDSATAHGDLARPTAAECQAADEMMKLGDHDLRLLVIFGHGTQ